MPQRRVSALLRRIEERRLRVGEEELRAYRPTERVVEIAEAMVGGALQGQEIAKVLDVHPSQVSRALADPVAAAWISKTLQELVSQRIGQVDAAMFTRAVAGDTRAAKLFFDRYAPMVQKHQHVIAHGEIDFSQLSDEDLDAMVMAETRVTEG